MPGCESRYAELRAKQRELLRQIVRELRAEVESAIVDREVSRWADDGGREP